MPVVELLLRETIKKSRIEVFSDERLPPLLQLE